MTDFHTDPRRACAQPGVDPETFYPDKAYETGPAKILCGRCPVIDACRTYALTTRQDHGVWGGLDWLEREILRRGGDLTAKQRKIAARRAAVAKLTAQNLAAAAIARRLGTNQRAVERDRQRTGLSKQAGGAKADPALWARMDELQDEGLAAAEVAERLHVAKRTVQRRRSARRAERLAVAA